MKKHEFYQRFANTPLPERTRVLDGITLLEIYHEINTMNPTPEREEKLLNLAEVRFKKKITCKCGYEEARGKICKFCIIKIK